MSEKKVLGEFIVDMNRNGNGKILLDKNNKVYFPDNRAVRCFKFVEPGDSVIAWVVKDFDKTGFVSLCVNNIPIMDYVKRIPERDPEYYLTRKLDNDMQRLHYELTNNSDILTRYVKDLNIDTLPVNIQETLKVIDLDDELRLGCLLVDAWLLKNIDKNGVVYG